MKILLKTLIAAFLLFSVISTSEAAMSNQSGQIMIEWYGHSCFLLTLNNGAKILIDPYDTSRLPYSLPPGGVDLTFSTHDHFDHNAVDSVPSKVILRADGRKPAFFGSKAGFTVSDDHIYQLDLKGIKLEVTTVPSAHDDRQGAQRGANGIIRFSVSGLTFAHLGDIGTMLSPAQIEQLKPVDILMIPVGGYYTIDNSTAQQMVNALAPKVVLPMHYKTDLLGADFPISKVDPLLHRFAHVHHNAGSTLALQPGNLPASLTIEVLKYHGQK